MKIYGFAVFVCGCFIMSGCKSNEAAIAARQSLRELNTPFSHPAFVQAIIDNDAEKVDLFLTGEIDADNGMQNSNPLRIAVANKRSDIVEKLLAHGVNVDPETFAGTPLCVAAAKNYTDIAKMLIAKGADVNYQQGDITPLIVASSMGNAEMVKLLLESGADVNLQGDAAEYSPLMLAAYNGHEEVVKLLLAAKNIDPKLVDRGGHIALSYAIVNEHTETARLLIDDDGFDPKTDGPENFTLAVSRHNLDIAQAIVERGCDINAKYGELPLLSWAIANNYTEGAKLLINSGADINQTDSADKIPMDYALASKNDTIINMLKTAAERLSEYKEKEPVVQ